MKISHTELLGAVYYWDMTKWGQILHLKFHKTWACEENKRTKPCQSLEYIQCYSYSSSSFRPFNSHRSSITYNCQEDYAVLQTKLPKFTQITKLTLPKSEIGKESKVKLEKINQVLVKQLDVKFSMGNLSLK